MLLADADDEFLLWLEWLVHLLMTANALLACSSS